MYVYKNTETGEVVERAERVPRFERFPQWTLVSKPRRRKSTSDRAGTEG